MGRACLAAAQPAFDEAAQHASPPMPFVGVSCRSGSGRARPSSACGPSRTMACSRRRSWRTTLLPVVSGFISVSKTGTGSTGATPICTELCRTIGRGMRQPCRRPRRRSTYSFTRNRRRKSSPSRPCDALARSVSRSAPALARHRRWRPCRCPSHFSRRPPESGKS